MQSAQDPLAEPLALSLKDVELNFDAFGALANATLSCARGEFISIVGPSGCGKSTLLEIIAGLREPTAGEIETHGSVGLVFQQPNLLPWRSVLRNVELLAEIDGVDKTDVRNAAHKALALVGLDDFADHLPGELSGGMQMRTSLARLLLQRPDIYLFDEPFGALDEITRQSLNEELSALLHGRDHTTVFVTHSVSEAVFLSDRVLIMSSRPGRIIEEIAVPFETPRRAGLRLAPEFFSLTAQISQALEAGQP